MISAPASQNAFTKYCLLNSVDFKNTVTDLGACPDFDAKRSEAIRRVFLPPTAPMIALEMMMVVKFSHFSWTTKTTTYRDISYIRRTKFQNLNVSRIALQLSLPNVLKPVDKLRMKM